MPYIFMLIAIAGIDSRNVSRQAMSGLSTAFAGVYGNKLSLFDVKLTVFRGFPLMVIVLA